MSFKCYLCDYNFTQKHNLEKHLDDKRCKSQLLNNWNSLNSLLEKLHKFKENPIITIGNNNNNNNNNNIKIEININPITKLDISHIEPSQMKTIIEKYENDKLNLLLGDYIKNMICDSDHPENQSVKYVTKKPPTYNSIIEDSDGKNVNVIKGLKDTCELLTDPILDQLKFKLKECLLKYKKEDRNDFDYSLYEDAFKELRKELNKETVKKVLKGVLQNDILHNIEMKFSLYES